MSNIPTSTTLSRKARLVVMANQHCTDTPGPIQYTQHKFFVSDTHMLVSDTHMRHVHLDPDRPVKTCSNGML